MALPRGATAVDFAYAVHTDIGNRCVAVKINQELMPLRSELKNGDRVEIITAAHAKPNALWLNFVATGRARSRIRHFLKTMHFQESAKLGERLLHQALLALGSSPADIHEPQWEKFARDAGARSREEVLADIGLGKRLAAVVARQLVRGEPGPHEPPVPGSVIIRGSEGMAVQFAPCCRPIPGGPVIGVISKGRGMMIHTHACPVMATARHDPEGVLDVAWDAETPELFEVNTRKVVANQRGVHAKVAAELAEGGSNNQSDSVDPEDGSSNTNIFSTLQVSNRLH